jgi:hypothetical protein
MIVLRTVVLVRYGRTVVEYALQYVRYIGINTNKGSHPGIEDYA